jgi:arylsulfatase A-like enzyme
VPPGWDQWHSATKDELDVYDYQLNNNGKLDHYGNRRRQFKQDVFTRHALRFVRRSAPDADPFYLQVDYTAPHGGGPKPSPQPIGNCQGSAKPAPRHAGAFGGKRLPQPPSFNERNVSDKPRTIRRLPRLSKDDIDKLRQRYRCRAASLLSVDEGVRKILKELERAGELGETLVIFTSDNAFFNGEHRVPKSKDKVYEAATRVPLMMRGPGVPDTTVGRPVTNADLAPTIVDAAGATASHAMDGVSLLDASPPARSLLIENKRFEAIRTSRYLYAEHNNGARELYDLRRDPHELRSKHASPGYDAAQADLSDLLDSLRSCGGAACRAVGDYQAKP